MDNIVWMPEGIIDECFRNFPDGIVTYSEDFDKSWRFACQFTKKPNIRWLCEQPWLVDWNELSQSTPENLQRVIQERDLSIRQDLDKFKAMPQAYKDENYQDFFRRHEKRCHELDSLLLVYQYLSGDVWFYLPPGAKPASHMTIWAKLRHIWTNKTKAS